MKEKPGDIKSNPYIRNDGLSITQRLLDKIFDDIFQNTDNELSHLKKFDYVYSILKYGNWSAEPDIFQYLNKKQLGSIRKKKAFFIFDACMEGFSPFDPAYKFFDSLYRSCKLHQVDHAMIIYISGNLEDEKNIAKWAESNNCEPFQVLSYNTFELVTMDASHHCLDINKLCNTALENCRTNFKEKYFSSLSRVNREQRTIATFLLCKHEVSKHALISHGKLTQPELKNLIQWGDHNGFTKQDITAWASELPFTIDYQDFNVNWAGMPFGHIHDQTIFQIVNETLQDSFNNTSLFYSEKTFRPILKFQPFLIYGQPGCNHKLQDYGYKLYDDWFDLSFDFEEDDTLRYKKLLESVKKACDHLDTLTREGKIAWRFKNEEILRHNCNVMKNSAYSKNKLYQFLKNLRT